MNVSADTRSLRHPCFNVAAKGSFGRVHLPVAPSCTIKCNFCDRRYDCVNESRPGVTSSVLTPDQALSYLDQVLAKEPRISVAGIAGPGDPFASAATTMATLAAIRRKHPDLVLCLSSNGLEIGPTIGELAELGVSHVTITVCAVDPEVGQQIYAWVRDGNVVYRGRQAAELLLKRQQQAIIELKRRDITVKVNCIVVPGVNDHHIVDVARAMQELGADLFNCMALFPAANTPFGSIRQPDRETMKRLRDEAERYLPQMRHCTRCRADAVGLLEDDRTGEFRSCLNSYSTKQPIQGDRRPYVAVASEEGILINRHLGEAERLAIWERCENGYQLVEERETPTAGGGVRRWHQLAAMLADCRAILVGGIGPTPREIMASSGVRPVEAAGFIEDGLRAIYENRKAGLIKGRKKATGKTFCTGSGGGCG
ncbi:MAG: nitrogenase cofactor biosynthesis protein NifB [Desulfofustis sp.]|nr:nitrogenase cofactor biosynthesis protein NifB [Desulfofustis sp.]